MKNHIIILGLCLLLSACGVVQPTYFGDKLTPTNTIDIYYSAHDVKQDYKVIGHLTISNIGQEKVKAKLADYAKTIGADAIVISGTNNIKDEQDAIITADALKYGK
jgi:hypothetical protein